MTNRLYEFEDTQAVLVANKSKICPCHLLGKEACESKQYGDSRVWCCSGAICWLESHVREEVKR